jgi:hypothetical protein
MNPEPVGPVEAVRPTLTRELELRRYIGLVVVCELARAGGAVTVPTCQLERIRIVSEPGSTPRQGRVDTHTRAGASSDTTLAWL